MDLRALFDHEPDIKQHSYYRSQGKLIAFEQASYQQAEISTLQRPTLALWKRRSTQIALDCQVLMGYPQLKGETQRRALSGS
jgi:hypothetical protein